MPASVPVLHRCPQRYKGSQHLNHPPCCRPWHQAHNHEANAHRKLTSKSEYKHSANHHDDDNNDNRHICLLRTSTTKRNTRTPSYTKHIGASLHIPRPTPSASMPSMLDAPSPQPKSSMSTKPEASYPTKTQKRILKPSSTATPSGKWGNQWSGDVHEWNRGEGVGRAESLPFGI